jgi:transcriptional regulator GlxA family with amidase domain
MTNSVNKTNTFLTDFNSEKINALCVWIAENCDNPIGWTQLSKESGLTHQELISLFQILKRQTPMAYIMNVREQKKKDLPRYPQANLFKLFSKTDNAEG